MELPEELVAPCGMYCAICSAYLAFKNQSGQVGWIKMNLGGLGGDIHYLAGAYNDREGGTIHVGAVPEPATTGLAALGLLALGARGVRRLRASRQQAGRFLAYRDRPSARRAIHW